MFHNKIFLSIFCLLFMTFCSNPSSNAKTGKDEKQNNTSAKADTSHGTNNEHGDNIVYTANGTSNNMWGVWGGGELSSADMAKFSFFKGWYVVYQWKKLEPQKGSFDWNYFDSQMKFAADNNLAIGFMVWVGPHTPQWVYDSGTPLVTTETKKKRTEFPYYLDKFYKERYFNMMKQVADHIQKMSPDIRKRIVMWMSAEGSTGDVVPYKGLPSNPAYNISEDQWFAFKKDVWTYMYKLCQSETPKINLLVNQGNGGQYFDWLTTNLPKVWMKAGNISHTYQFNGELEYYARLKKLESKVAEDSMANRLRGEITVQGTWFNQNESWNMYALLTSALHFGLDIFNAAPKYLQNPADTTAFKFFNFYAGQKVASKSPGAFCVFKDALDASDTKRFPESKYGPVIDASDQANYSKELQRRTKRDRSDDEEDDGDDEGIDASNVKNDHLSQNRVNKILAEYAPYGAKRGDMNDLDDEDNSAATTTKDEPKVTRSGKPMTAKRQEKLEQKGKLNKGSGNSKATGYQKKREANMVINDIGVNLIPDNYYRFLTQYSPNTTSRGYWRVGPNDQPYGRFARGFDAKNGMTEMFFALDKNFFKGSTSPEKVAVRIIYLDKGTGSWSLNYSDGSSKKEAYKITCGNSGNWITKTIMLDAVFAGKLEHSSDVSIKYLSGDNTIFNSIEILRQ